MVRSVPERNLFHRSPILAAIAIGVGVTTRLRFCRRCLAALVADGTGSARYFLR